MADTADKVIINASPLIFLSHGGHLKLLKSFADEVWIPNQVAAEILHRGEDDITARAIGESAWLVTRPIQDIPETVLEWRLGVGESAVIAMGISNPRTEVIIDDLAGRRCAHSLGIPVRGTLGLVLAAKRRGIIPEARPVIDDMKRSGLYLSKRVVDAALAKVGE